MKLQPIIPYEPIKTEQIPKGDQWISQVKWDGVRLLTYYDEKTVKLYNRKLNERTFHYPELLQISNYCNAKSVILDGEIIALGDHEKPSFSTVMKRDGIRRLDKIPYVQKLIPITYMIFDVIYYNGNWINKHKLTDRLHLLAKIILPTSTVQVVPSFVDSEELFDVMKEQGMEGIVVKDLNSPYSINGKNDKWQKIKNYQDLIAVVGGVTLRQGVVNSLLLGLYNAQNNLIYIGHAGTGKLTRADWVHLTELIKPLIIKSNPFINKPDRVKESIWLKPSLTVKVNYLEWSYVNQLRQPSIQAFVDVPPTECKLEF